MTTMQSNFSLSDSLRKDKLFGASYGTVKNGIAEYAFILTNKERTCKIHGGGKFPGDPDTLSSLCAETAGALGLVAAIWHISDLSPPICQCTFQAYIDNKTVLSRIHQSQMPHNRMQPLIPDYNMAKQLAEEITDSPSKGNWQWVKSHQEGSTIDIELNGEADDLAAQYQNDLTPPPPYESPTSTKIWFESPKGVMHHLRKKIFHDQL